MSASPIKGVLFDMDDTLIDWSNVAVDWNEIERQHIRRVWDFLAAHDRTPQTDLDTLTTTYRDNVVAGWADARSTLRAPHMGSIMMNTLAEFGIEPDDVVTERACLTAYGWRGVEGVRVFPDVPPVLQTLIDQDYTIGILTNTFQPMWVREAELERFDLMQYFPDEQQRMSAADLDYVKPHRRIFEQALERLGTSAEETIYIGDNPVADIAGAQGAGMRAVLRIKRPAPPLISGLIVPDAAINSFDELLPLLNDWTTYATGYEPPATPPSDET